jgi:hypothetical protein
VRGPHLRSAHSRSRDAVPASKPNKPRPSRTTKRKEKLILLPPFAQREKKLYRFRIPTSRLDSTYTCGSPNHKQRNGRGFFYAYDALASIFTSRIEDRRYDVVISFTCFHSFPLFIFPHFFGCDCYLVLLLESVMDLITCISAPCAV